MNAATSRVLVALSPLLLFAPVVRDLTEARMAVHMLLQFPWLLAAGAAAAAWAPQRLQRCFDRVDVDGLLGAVVATALTAFWMLPIAVDLALLSTPMRLAKYTSLALGGLLLARSLPRWTDGTLAFFAGNLAWMLATAGLLYVDAPARLCLSYLQDDQRLAGQGLIAGAVAVAAWAVDRLVRSPDSAARSGS